MPLLERVTQEIADAMRQKDQASLAPLRHAEGRVDEQGSRKGPGPRRRRGVCRSWGPWSSSAGIRWSNSRPAGGRIWPIGSRRRSGFLNVFYPHPPIQPRSTPPWRPPWPRRGDRPQGHGQGYESGDGEAGWAVGRRAASVTRSRNAWPDSRQTFRERLASKLVSGGQAPLIHPPGRASTQGLRPLLFWVRCAHLPVCSVTASPVAQSVTLMSHLRRPGQHPMEAR